MSPAGPAGPFQVFIEGAAGGPDALANLGNVMAQRYGMPETDLLERLARGRTRVKSTPDLAVARAMQRELEAMGACCNVVDASGAVIPPDGAPGAPGAAPPPPRPSGQMQSGLAAAGTGPTQDLGALGSAGALSLAALDGNDEPPPSRTMTARSIAPPQLADGGQFAPPEDSEVALTLTLDVASPPRRTTAPAQAIAVARTQTPLPPVSAAVRGSLASTSAAAITLAPGARRAGVMGWLADPTVRFAVGVALCLGLAFVPAHLIGRARERPALAEIDATLRQRQAQVVTTEDWQQLDRVRSTFRARKEDTRREHGITMVAIWLGLAGALGFVWFRQLDWERLTRHSA